MSKDQRQFRPVQLAVHDMKIGPANRAGGHLDQHLAWAGRWDCHRLASK